MLGRVIAEVDHPQSAGAIQDVQSRKAGYAETLCGWSPGIFIGSNAEGIDGWVEHQISLGEVGLRFGGRFPVFSRIEGEDQDVWIVTVFSLKCCDLGKSGLAWCTPSRPEGEHNNTTLPVF